MTRIWPNDLDAHEAYYRTLTEDSDSVARNARRAGIAALARPEKTEPAPLRPPPRPLPQPWYENVIALLGGAFGAAIAIAAVVFAAAVMW